jgi:hypothetical protein
MYAEQPTRQFSWPEADPYDSPYRSFDAERDRLTHLVLVDGRLVDVWSEPVIGTRWEHHADRFDRERRPAVSPPAAPPLHEQVLTWLDAAVGGREPLLALHTRPLVDRGFEPDPDLRPADRERLAACVDLLDRAARELRVPEARAVLMTALRVAWTADPEALLDVGEAARLAGGICWVAAKANGLLGPGGTTTQTGLQHTLGCRIQLSLPGRSVHRLLVGYWPDPPRPAELPDILLVGRPDLLTAATRRRLLRARDQALAAQSVAEASPPLVSPE